MKDLTVNISESDLRQIVKEELSALVRKPRAKSLSEELDHEGARKVVTGASKLLKAALVFSEDATGAMTNALHPHLEAIRKSLESMVTNPSSYVDRPKQVPRVVKLRAVAPE